MGIDKQANIKKDTNSAFTGGEEQVGIVPDAQPGQKSVYKVQSGDGGAMVPTGNKNGEWTWRSARPSGC